MKKWQKMVIASVVLAGALPAAGFASDLEGAAAQAGASFGKPVSVIIKEAREVEVTPVEGAPVQDSRHNEDPWGQFPKSSLQKVVDSCVQNKPEIHDADHFASVYGGCIRGVLPVQNIWADNWGLKLMIQLGQSASQDETEKANGLITVPGENGRLFRIILDVRREERERPGRD